MTPKTSQTTCKLAEWAIDEEGVELESGRDNAKESTSWHLPVMLLPSVDASVNSELASSLSRLLTTNRQKTRQKVKENGKKELP